MHTHTYAISHKKKHTIRYFILFYLLFFTIPLYVNCFLLSFFLMCSLEQHAMSIYILYKRCLLLLLYVFDILMESSYRRRSLPATDSHTYTHILYDVLFVRVQFLCATSSSSTVPYSSILFFCGTRDCIRFLFPTVFFYIL